MPVTNQRFYSKIIIKWKNYAWSKKDKTFIDAILVSNSLLVAMIIEFWSIQ